MEVQQQHLQGGEYVRSQKGPQLSGYTAVSLFSALSHKQQSPLFLIYLVQYINSVSD